MSDSGVPQRRAWGDVTIIVERWDGTLHRWAGDELDAANVPCDLVYTTSMPGGFKTATCTLFRDILHPAPEGLFDDVRILGPGQQVYWEGRLQSMPSSTDGGGRINPTAVGWSAHLEDRQDVQVIYVDRDLAQWGPVTDARRLGIIGAQYRPIDGAVGWDDSAATAGPMIRLWHGPGEVAWTSNQGRAHVMMRYDAGGATVANIEARIGAARDTGGWGLAAIGFSRGQQTITTATDWSSSGIAVGQLKGAGLGPGTRSVEVQWLWPTAPAGNPEGSWGVGLAEVAVYGDLTGVTAGRTDSPTYGPGQGPYGVTASSVIRDVVARWAPHLRVDDESIQATSYLIPHLVQRDPGSATSPIELANRFHWWDWAVWEDRRLWYHERFGGPSRTWLVSTEDGAALSLEGDTTDLIYNGCVVSYTDFGGVQHTIGPPGSTAEQTDPRLLSPDPDNPATLHGIQRWGHFALSEPVNAEGAVLCGMAWLDAQSQATRRGSCTVAGSVLDDAGNEHPVDMVRAGDRLIVTDRPDDPPRRVIETSVDRNQRTNTLTLDSTAQTLEALLERMGASLVGVL